MSIMNNSEENGWTALQSKLELESNSGSEFEDVADALGTKLELEMDEFNYEEEEKKTETDFEEAANASTEENVWITPDIQTDAESDFEEVAAASDLANKLEILTDPEYDLEEIVGASELESKLELETDYEYDLEEVVIGSDPESKLEIETDPQYDLEEVASASDLESKLEMETDPEYDLEEVVSASDVDNKLDIETNSESYFEEVASASGGYMKRMSNYSEENFEEATSASMGYKSASDDSCDYMQTMYISQTCGRTFPTREQLDEHAMQCAIQCKHCLEIFSCDNYELHQSVKPKAAKKKKQTYACGTCGKILKHAASLKRHELTHTQTYRHKCQYCTADYKRLDNLKRHLHLKH